MNKISQIQINGTNYDLKDNEAQTNVNTHINDTNKNVWDCPDVFICTIVNALIVQCR